MLAAWAVFDLGVVPGAAVVARPERGVRFIAAAALGTDGQIRILPQSSIDSAVWVESSIDGQGVPGGHAVCRSVGSRGSREPIGASIAPGKDGDHVQTM